MTHLADFLLLADESRFDELGYRFRHQSGGFDMKDLIVILGVLAVLALVTWLAIHCAILIRHHKRHSPFALFLTLCRAHRIDWSSRWLLWRLAQAHGLPQPAQLFIEPRLFDVQFLGHLPSHHRRQLEKVSARIFAER